MFCWTAVFGGIFVLRLVVCWGGCFTVKIAVVLVKNCCLVVVKLVINKAFGRIQLVLKLLRPLSR